MKTKNKITVEWLYSLNFEIAGVKNNKILLIKKWYNKEFAIFIDFKNKTYSYSYTASIGVFYNGNLCVNDTDFVLDLVWSLENVYEMDNNTDKYKQTNFHPPIFLK